MRLVTWFTVLVLAGLALFSDRASAQTSSDPVITRVTVHDDSGVLTVSGTGLSAELLVTVGGEQVAVMPGATRNTIQVRLPGPIMSEPGTYRVTVLDAVRRVGDVFEVTRLDGRALRREGMAAAEAEAPFADAPAVGRRTSSGAAGSESPSPRLVENGVNTAVGEFALYSVTTGTLNVAVGNSALSYNTVGNLNTASGHFALRNSTGDRNTAHGAGALYSNTTSADNAATGFSSLYFNTTGTMNTATGSQSLYYNTTGDHNTAAGAQSLYGNQSGSFNTGLGSGALMGNVLGGRNTATGANALRTNPYGSFNTANGFEALASNQTGSENAAFGVEVLHENTYGSHNTAGGHQSLYYNTYGFDNAAWGTQALVFNTTGQSNTAAGMYSLYGNTSGHRNVGLGYNAGAAATVGHYNIFLGADVAGTVSDSNTIRIGSPFDGSIGQNQTFIAGIHGTQLSGPAVQVFVDANGQLGTITPPVAGGTGSVPPAQLNQQVRDQQTEIESLRNDVRGLHAANADLRARLARLEVVLSAPRGRR